MKRCITCGCVKPVTDYYRHPKMADGHLSKCKECQKASSRAARLASLGYYQAYDRTRGDLPERKQANTGHSPSPDNEWRKRNPSKGLAHGRVARAIRDGSLVRGSCERCGEVKTHAHHDDYSQPLIVRWLCSNCHHALHRAERDLPRLGDPRVTLPT